MNLAAGSKFFKRWLVIIVVIVVLIGVWGLFSKRSVSVKEVEISTTVSTAGKLFEYSGDPLDLPKEVGMYVFDTEVIVMSLTQAKLLAAQLGFRGESQIVEDVAEGEVHIWSEGGQSLSVSPASGRWSYNQTPGVSSTVSLPGAQPVAVAFLEKTGFGGRLQLDGERSRYLEDQVGLYQVVARPDQADASQFFFRYQVGARPLFEETAAVSSVAVTVRGDQVTKLEGWFLDDSHLVSKGNLALKSFDQVVEDLRAGKAGVLSLDAETKEFSRAIFTRVELGYLRRTGEGLLMPVVVFYGEAQLPNETVAGLVVAVLAVK